MAKAADKHIDLDCKLAFLAVAILDTASTYEVTMEKLSLHMVVLVGIKP